MSFGLQSIFYGEFLPPQFCIAPPFFILRRRGSTFTRANGRSVLHGRRSSQRLPSCLSLSVFRRCKAPIPQNSPHPSTSPNLPSTTAHRSRTTHCQKKKKNLGDMERPAGHYAADSAHLGNHSPVQGPAATPAKPHGVKGARVALRALTTACHSAT